MSVSGDKVSDPVLTEHGQLEFDVQPTSISVVRENREDARPRAVTTGTEMVLGAGPELRACHVWVPDPVVTLQ